MLPAVRPGTHGRLPVTNRRKVGTTSSHHAPYAQGYARGRVPKGRASLEVAQACMLFSFERPGVASAASDAFSPDLENCTVGQNTEWFRSAAACRFQSD